MNFVTLTLLGEFGVDCCCSCCCCCWTFDVVVDVVVDGVGDVDVGDVGIKFGNENVRLRSGEFDNIDDDFQFRSLIIQQQTKQNKLSIDTWVADDGVIVDGAGEMIVARGRDKWRNRKPFDCT